MAKNVRRPKPQSVYVDPWVERVAAELQRSRLTDEQIAAKVSKARPLRGMSPKTVTNVRELITRRPYNDTLDWLLWAVGRQRAISDL